MKAVSLAAVALVGVTAASCTKDSTKPSVPVAAVVVTAASTSVLVDSTDQFTATPEDGSGNVLSGRAVTWISATPSVATVSARGLMVAVAPGTATIRASSEGVTGSDSVTVVVPSTTIVVTNQLIDAVNISANGTVLGSVPGGGTAQATVTVSPLTVSYELILPQTTGGTSMGEQMSGVYQTIQNPPSTVNVTVNNVLGSQTYFAPLITNNGANPILMAVNWGTGAENRCNCTVPAFSSNVQIGYYRLFSNTEVAAFGFQSGYGNGSYSYWLSSDFQGGIASGSGEVALTNNTTLTSGPARPVGVPGQLGDLLLNVVRPMASRSPVGPVYDHAMPLQRSDRATVMNHLQ